LLSVNSTTFLLAAITVLHRGLGLIGEG
jgi:hypothetical protein